MTLTAELPLVFSALALSLVALLRVVARPDRPWADHVALAVGALAAIAPLALYPFIPVEAGVGRALWQWSAIGGPTIQASYRLDGIGAIGASTVAAYTVAALFATTRERARPPLLLALLLGMGHTALALAVIDDFIAAIVLLGVLAALTTAVALLVMPPLAGARVAAYLAVGLQFFVLAALLISRFGAASFQFAEIRPTAISPGTILAASLGAALFAGLYPFIPWRYDTARGTRDRETLRGLLVMPTGICATLVLLRLLGVTRADLSSLGLPGLDPTIRLLVGAAILVSVAAVAIRRQVIPGRSIVGGGALLFMTVMYPTIHWSHVALAAALLTVLYAAAASLALPEEWEVARHDVTLATLWIGMAVGTPVAIAAGLALIVVDSALAVAESIWLPPHRGHLVLVVGATALVTGLGALGAGLPEVTEPVASLLGLVAVVVVVFLHLTHLERRVQLADPPFLLDAASAALAFLVCVLFAIVLAPALAAGVAVTLGRDYPLSIQAAPVSFPVLASLAVLIVAAARALRPLLPDLEPLGRRLVDIVELADPVPAAGTAFTVLDWTATRVVAGLAFLERRAGVGLATALILALLVWSVR